MCRTFDPKDKMTNDEALAVKVYYRNLNTNCQCNICTWAKEILRREHEALSTKQEKEFTLFQPQQQENPRQ